MRRELAIAGRVAAWTTGVLMFLVSATLAAGWLAGRSDWGHRRLLALAVPRIAELLDGELRIGGLQGDLVRGLVLEDVEIVDRERQAAVRAQRLTLHYNLAALLWKTVRIREAKVEGLWVGARHLAGGELNLATLLKPTPSTPPEANPIKVDVHHLLADIEVQYEPPADASGPGGTVSPGRARVLLEGGAQIVGSAVELRQVTATVETTGEEMNHVLPSAELFGSFQASVQGDGPLSDLALAVEIHPPSGSVVGEGRVAIAETVAWTGEVQIHGLDPGAATRHAPAGSIDASVEGHGEGTVGVVRVGALEIDALAAHASAHGEIDLEGHGQAEVALRAEDLSRLAEIGVPGLAGAVEAQATMHRAATTLSLDGKVIGKGSRAGSLRINAIHLRARADGSALVVHGDATGPQQFAFALDLAGEPLWRGDALVGADVSIDRLALARGSVKWANARAARLRVDSAIELKRLVLASGSQSIALEGRYEWEQESKRTLRALLTTHQVDAAQLIGLVRSAPPAPPILVDAELRVSGSVDRPIANLKAAAVSRLLEPPKRIELRTEARYAAERITGQLALTAEKAAVHGKFDLPASTARGAPIALDLDVKKVQLSDLRELLPTPLADLRGELTAHLRAGGTMGTPSIDGDLHAASWQVGTVVIDDKEIHNDTTLSLGYRAGQLRVRQSTKLGHAAGRVDFDAAMPVDLRALIAQPAQALERLERVAPVVASAKVERLDLARLPFESIGVARLVSTGVIDVGVQLRGTLSDPELHGTARAGNVSREGLVDKVDVAVALDLVARRALVKGTVDLRGRRLVDASGETRVDMEGILRGRPFHQTALQLHLAIPDYDLALLRGMRPQLDTVAGKLAAGIDVSGDFNRQVAQAHVSVAGLRLGRTEFSAFVGAADFDGATAHVQVDADQKAGGRLHLLGTIPRAESAPWTLGLKAERFDLAFLAGTLSALRSARGSLESSITVAGTRGRPALDAEVRVSDGAFQLRVDPHTYDKIEIAASVHRGTLRLANLSAMSGKGTLKATGDATLEGFAPTRVDAKAETHEFALVFGTLAAWLDSQIVVHAEGTPRHLRATVHVGKGLARLPKLASSRKLQPTGEPPRVTFIDKRAREERVEQLAAASGDSDEAGIRIKIPGPFYIRSKEANAELRGELDLVVRNSDVSLNGSAEASTGWIDLLGQRYLVDHARVAFGGDPVNPDLDIRIIRRLREARIIVDVRGTGSRPRLDLHSDPPIYDRSQILGIILSGDPAGQRVSDRGLDQKVVGAVSGLVLGKLKDTIAPKLPIDLIHVQTGSTGYTGLAQTRIEVGKYLTENLYVSYVHQFGQPTPNTVSNANEAHVEYRFKRDYEIDTSFGDAGAGGVDLYWIHRY